MTQRHGIEVRAPRDRGAEILRDPDGYFRRARTEAAAVVERDMARERPTRRSTHAMTRERNPAAPWNVAAPQQAKALVGALVAGLTTLASAMADDRVTGGEWVGVAIAAVATYGSVFGARNATPGRRRNDEA